MKYENHKFNQNSGFKINNYSSKLTIIDLAGSEKFTKDADQKNSSLIRKSLLNLKLFINNLHNGNNDGNIQCRNSVLTKLIKDSVVSKQ